MKFNFDARDKANSNSASNSKSNLKSNLKWYVPVGVVVVILLIMLTVLNSNQKKLIADLEFKLDKVILDNQKANEEISKLNSEHEQLEKEMDQYNADHFDEMAQDITLNHRKIVAISELVDNFSNISILKGNVVSYTDNETFVVEIQLDNDQMLSDKIIDKVKIETGNKEEHNDKGFVDGNFLGKNTHLWLTIPLDVAFYAADTVGVSKTENGEFYGVIRTDLSGDFKQFYPYSFVFVEDRLVQIYQGNFDLSDDD